MDELFAFLRSQQLLTIATHNGKTPWTANAFYCVDENKHLYFISSKETNHMQHILKDPEMAFNIAWYNPNDHTDRKAIQGRGLCYQAKSEKEIARGVHLHNQRYPEFAEKITVDWITDTDNDSCVWVIKPRYVKFWNDTLFGEDGVREIEIPFQ